MLSPADYVIWLVGFLSEIAVVVCCIYRREFFSYLSVSLYMLLCAVGDCGVYVCSQRFGIHSKQYFYSYFTSDILLSILMYVVIVELFKRVLADTAWSRYVRGAAGILLGATALFAFIAAHQPGLLTREFAVELEQDLNFVGVVLSFLLLGAVIQLRETRLRLVQLILALGVYFSGVAATYALRNLFPDLELSALRWLPPLIGAWLPLAWAYTFIRVPGDARFGSAAVGVTTE